MEKTDERKNRPQPLPQTSLPADRTLLSIIFQNEDFLVLNKPTGILVHGRESLENVARAYLEPSLSPSLSFRPGPLHRLDRETSGLIVFSASLEGARTFSEALQARKIEKSYLALLDGELDCERCIDAPLLHDRSTKTSSVSSEGQSARSRISPLVQHQGKTFALVEIYEGRTHQIRAHAAYMGLPLWGDGRYGSRRPAKKGEPPFFLHAYLIRHGGDSGLSLPKTVSAPLSSAQDLFLGKILGSAFQNFLEF